MTGLLTNTFGCRTYPVAYTFDVQGRMRTMTTWANFASAAGAAVTTWNYDAYRGFLTNKIYADGHGPLYSYTPAGRLQSRTWARGIVTTYGYNDAGDLATQVYSDGTTPSVTNTWDRLGRLVQAVTTNYTASLYNGAGQLLGESWAGGPLDGLSVTNELDSLLRRSALTARSSEGAFSSTRYGYDRASRLQSVVSGPNVVTYDYVPNSPLVGSLTFR